MTDIILISGGSCSGKSALAEALEVELDGRSVAICSVDDYYIDLSHLSEGQIDQYNFDHPDAIEKEILLDDINMLAQGLSVHTPVYDFAKHRRAGFRLVGPCDVIIVEGIFALYFQQLREMAKMSVFVDCSNEVRFARRLSRDVAERGFTREEVIDVYHNHVEPMFKEYIQPCMRYADLVVSGEVNVASNAEKVLEKLADEAMVHRV